jgi:hypothetical protein
MYYNILKLKLGVKVMYCNKCQHNNKAEANFCGKCGRLLTEEKSESKLLSLVKANKNQFLIYAISALVVLLCIIVLIARFGDFDTRTAEGPNGAKYDKIGFDALYADAVLDYENDRYQEAAQKFSYIPEWHDKYEEAMEQIDDIEAESLNS